LTITAVTSLGRAVICPQPDQWGDERRRSPAGALFQGPLERNHRHHVGCSAGSLGFLPGDGLGLLPPPTALDLARQGGLAAAAHFCALAEGEHGLSAAASGFSPRPVTISPIASDRIGRPFDAADM